MLILHGASSEAFTRRRPATSATWLHCSLPSLSNVFLPWGSWQGDLMQSQWGAHGVCVFQNFQSHPKGHSILHSLGTQHGRLDGFAPGTWCMGASFGINKIQGRWFFRFNQLHWKYLTSEGTWWRMVCLAYMLLLLEGHPTGLSWASKRSSDNSLVISLVSQPLRALQNTSSGSSSEHFSIHSRDSTHRPFNKHFLKNPCSHFSALAQLDPRVVPPGG